MTTPHLAVDSLSVAYGPTIALSGLSLAAAKGEFIALLGPSGCGKTSLLRAIAGFVPARAGRILLAGQDIAAIPPRRRNIGIVFQSYALFPHMSALANVRFGLDCRPIPRAEATARARDALALVGLEALAERRPAQLSGGQQQRVALARALVIAPDLLLLDEPLAALDKQLRVQMQTELRALQQRLGVTALFVTHDREEALSMADRVAVLHQGRIRQLDTPARLFAAPADSWVAAFIGAGNLLPDGPGQPGLDLPALPGPGLLFFPHDRVRLSPAPGGPRIAAARFLGLATELHIETARGLVRALLPAADAARFPIGTPVALHVAPEHARRIPLAQGGAM